MKKRIAIVGSSGYISQFIINEIYTKVDIKMIDKIKDDGICYLDLSNADEFNYDQLVGIDYIIFTAAISGPDQCATEYDVCWKINVIGTIKFISKAIERNCCILFFSSDAVFGNIPGMIYNENSQTRAITPYGRMKKAVEDEFKGNKYFKAIRLSYVVSSKDRFVTYCLNSMRYGNMAEIYHPFYRNCISVQEVVQLVIWLINNWEGMKTPFINAAGSELVSRLRIADEINQLYNNKLKYIIVKPADAFYSNRPAITQMESLFIYNMGIIKREPFTRVIAKALEGVKI